ncbi:hypothetical protein OIM90_25490 [Streptomyces sp. AD16]|nr:hypothetical protein OIM90_25490 [Streptomyces sp. AD16]
MVKHFGSVRKLRAATVEQICEVPGIGRKTALAVAATLSQSTPSVAVNTATGEIVGDDDTDEAPESGEAPATPGRATARTPGAGRARPLRRARGTDPRRSPSRAGPPVPVGWSLVPRARADRSPPAPAG